MPRSRSRSDIGRRSRASLLRRNSRENMYEEQRSEGNTQLRVRAFQRRAEEEPRRSRSLQRSQQTNNLTNKTSFHRVAFSYDSNAQYSSNKFVQIGAMDMVCPYCNALRFKEETPGICCSSGKVKLPVIDETREPLKTLCNGLTDDSKNFLKHIRYYNSCFQMTSFGANVITENYMPTFKIQGQVYHSAVSLLPFPNESHKFLKIYFIGDEHAELDARCRISTVIKRYIITILKKMLHDHNTLIRMFKYAIDRMPSDNHKIVICADQTPATGHVRRYNAPAVDEIAIVMVGEEFHPRDIILHRRNDQLQRIYDTHRCYDPLQYPIMFPNGQDGYHFNLKMVDPVTGEHTNKKISSMDFYAYRIMIRENESDHILKCRQLFHQYIVDMYAKNESERLLYIKFNQKKLRSEEYIHLRDAIINDGAINEIGKMVILPATYTGSPRHMQQYAEDAFTYECKYGRPDLFITSTCNPAWNEIKECLLTGQTPADYKQLWQKYKDCMAEDLLHRIRQVTNNEVLGFTDEIYNAALIKIEDLCLTICGKLLVQIGLTAPNRSTAITVHLEWQKEYSYNILELQQFLNHNVCKLNEEQQIVFDTIIEAIDDQSSGIYFLDAPGGTGKTFLIALNLAKVRSHGHIALALASSGIAATLMEGGRTAHSALKLPLNIECTENPTCNISKTSVMGKVLQQCKIIIWDECTMAHKKSLEAPDITLKDLRNNQNPFGGALILLSGDFRQTLPVIPRSKQFDELHACLKYSKFWTTVKKLHLTKNMRVHLHTDVAANIFSKQLLEVGNGTISINPETGTITLPFSLCNIVRTKDELVQNVFPNINGNYRNPLWLSERAILVPINKDVDELNDIILNNINGETVTYKSIDTVINQDEVVNFPTEFLNSLDISGLPSHVLKLKIGVPIILLRNINLPKLCNGTRLIVKKLMPNVIEATILSGPYKGEDVLILRIPLIPTDIPFEFKRLQIPIRLAFAMTINKAQGQSFKVCGLNLEHECFSHGQLYVACSRVGSPENLHVYAEDGQTKNVVYPLALQ